MSRWRWVLVIAYLVAVYLSGMSSMSAWARGAESISLFYLAAGIWFAWCLVGEVRTALHDAHVGALIKARDTLIAAARDRGIEVPR